MRDKTPSDAPTIDWPPIDWLKVPHSYHCATHGWWDAKRESGCPTCVAQMRRELTAARSKIERLEKDGARYAWLRYRVSGQYDELAPNGQDFVLTPPDVMYGQNIMKGSVAQHFDAAIDAAIITEEGK